MTKNEQDGHSNTRPERRLQSDMRVLVDWVTVSFFLAGDFDDVKVVLGIENLDMEYHDWGMNTYKEHLRFSNIKIQRKNNNIYQLALSGQGCREFESLSKYSWLELFSILKDFTNCNFTRIDIAIDDFLPHYTVDRVRKVVKEGRAVTRLQSVEEGTRFNASSNEVTMDWLYFGSMNSRLSINIYDKRLERQNDGKEVMEEFWTRTELRIKREYANQVVDMILLYESDLGKVAFGVLHKNLRFVRRSKAKNKREVPTVKWWADYIGEVDKLPFSLEAPDRTIEKTKDWIFNSVAPAFAAIQEAEPELFHDFIRDLIQDGQERLNEKHGIMIEQHKALKYAEAKEKIRQINGEFNENPNLHQRIFNTFNEKNVHFPR